MTRRWLVLLAVASRAVAHSPARAAPVRAAPAHALAHQDPAVVSSRARALPLIATESPTPSPPGPKLPAPLPWLIIGLAFVCVGALLVGIHRSNASDNVYQKPLKAGDMVRAALRQKEGAGSWSLKPTKKKPRPVGLMLVARCLFPFFSSQVEHLC